MTSGDHNHHASPGWLQHKPHHGVTEHSPQLVLDVSDQVAPGKGVIRCLDLLSLGPAVSDKNLNKELRV